MTAPALPKMIKKLSLKRCRPGLLASAELPSDTEAVPAPYQLEQTDEAGNGRDANCLMCHADPDFRGRFQNGETISLYVHNGNMNNRCRSGLLNESGAACGPM